VGEVPGLGERTARALHAAFCRGASRGDLLTLAARKLKGLSPVLIGTYIYLLEDDSIMSLEASEGPSSDHLEIPLAALAADHGSLADQLADLIRNDWGWHSAMVALIRRHDLTLGSIVVRSPSPLEQGRESVVQVADALAALL